MGIRHILISIIFTNFIIFVAFLLPHSALAQTTESTSFLYNASGQRIARMEESGDWFERVYYISPSLEITVRFDRNEWRKNYVLPGGSSAVREKKGTDPENVYYIHQDHLGSTSLVTDSDGYKVAKQRYYPYGATRVIEGILPTDKEYTGQVSDMDQTGLYYYNARYYDPLLAKFTQADTVNDGLNRYAYVGNNPVNRIDPTGNRYIEESGIFSADQNTILLNPESNILDTPEEWKINVPQKKYNDCSVATTVMLLQYHLRSQEVYIDSNRLYAYLAEEYDIPEYNPTTPYTTITNTLDELGIEYHVRGKPYRPVTAELLDDFLHQYGPAILNISGTYKAGANLNHYVVIYDIHQLNGYYYAEVGDPLANTEEYSFERLDNDNFLVPYPTLKGAYGDLFLWIEEPETVRGIRDLFPRRHNDQKVVPEKKKTVQNYF